jgi:LmbE family N-acetylglucosaminyl deacetylase
MRILVIAPHPDDETLGCAGLLLRRKAEGADLGWLIVTDMSEKFGWSAEQIALRDGEIARVSQELGFSEVFHLGFPTAQLDTIPLAHLVERFSHVLGAFGPDEVLVPHWADVHSDHRVVFEATAACTKWFRHPGVRRILAYETPSETGFHLVTDSTFHPTTFVDIGAYLERKLTLMALYRSEVHSFPFPRSVEAVRALAAWRGASSGFEAAEAFELLKERG